MKPILTIEALIESAGIFHRQKSERNHAALIGVTDGANREDIIAFLQDRNVPGDEIVYGNLADEILSRPPEQGYLTVSNALQWRLQYARVIELRNGVSGVVNL